VLTPDSQQLRDVLNKFHQSIPADARKAPEFVLVEKMLKSLGYGEETSQFVNPPRG